MVVHTAGYEMSLHVYNAQDRGRNARILQKTHGQMELKEEFILMPQILKSVFHFCMGWIFHELFVDSSYSQSYLLAITVVLSPAVA